MRKREIQFCSHGKSIADLCYACDDEFARDRKTVRFNAITDKITETVEAAVARALRSAMPRFDAGRLEAAQAQWRYQHTISVEDIPWLLDIAANRIQFITSDPAANRANTGN